MKQLQHDLREQFTLLKETFSRVSEQLAQAAQGIEEDGLLPSEKVAEELVAVRTSFMTLRVRVLELVESLAVTSLPIPEEIASLSALESLFQTITKAEEQRTAFEEIRRRALGVLDGILAIAHREYPEFPPLRECQANARELRHAIEHARWPHMPPTAESLADGAHPLVMLMTLMEQCEELADDRWALLQETISQGCGRALAVAAARGKLFIPPAPEEPSLTLPAPNDATHLLAEQPEPAASSSMKPSIPPQPPPMTGGEILLRGEAALTQKSEDSSEPSTEPPTDAMSTPSLQEVALSPQGTASSEVTAGQEQETRKQTPVEKAAMPKEQPPYRLSLEATAQEMAVSLLNDAVEDRPESLRDLMWQLIFEKKIGLAFQVACCLDTLYPDLWPRHPSWLLRAVNLGPHVCHATGEIAPLLSEDFGKFSDECFAVRNSMWNHAVRFLLAAAALRPALLAPETNASVILHSLHMKEGLAQLYEYCKLVATYGEQGLALDPAALKKVKNQAAWQAEMDALRQAVEAWCVQAPQMTMAYAPATAVWRKWQAPHGLMHSLLLPIRQNDLSKLQEIKSAVQHLSDDAQIRREVDHTDRNILGRRGSDAITAKALAQLRMRVREAVGYVRRWVTLQESRPGSSKDYLQRRAEQLRQEIWSRQEAVLNELRSFEQRGDSISILGAISYCRSALENLQVLFDPEASFPDVEPLPKHLLYADLLRIPSLSLNEEWEPEPRDPGFLLNGILDLVAHERFDWRWAFDAHCGRRDHEVTTRILEYLEANPPTSVHLDELREDRNKHLRECQAALRRDVEETRKQVEGAVTFGLLRELERVDYAGKLDRIEIAVPDTLRFFEKHDQLRSIRDAIRGKREAEIQSIKQRLDSTQIHPGHPAYDRICSALEQGDALTANEYIDMALRNLPLPEIAPETDAFGSFFPQALRAIADFMEPPHPANRPDPFKIVNDVRSYAKAQRRTYAVGPVDMGRVLGSQATQAADMLEAWFTAKKTQRMDEVGARQILTSLGFNVLRLAVNKSRRHTWMDLVTEPIRDKKRCPVPAYGSQANGRYRVLCVWDRPTEEDLLNDVGDTSHGSSVLVLHFGRMTEQRRRDLAYLCRDRRRPFIVIDDTLVLYLCGERGSRLPVLFECALPFTFLEPYTITAGVVPSEMFYGRQRERDSIVDPMGTCFIYGGRQLGKTALLRYVERTFHAPQQGEIALWLDLKTYGIGYDRAIDEIWNLLAAELKPLGVVPASMPMHASADRLLEHIRAWLEEDEGRRVLLLLDEADRFLEIDGRRPAGGKDVQGEFMHAARLKGLMDRTNRRFKLVFAGLHNVLRTTKLENHPLAHYGDPICIGPLLDNGEWREARALIEGPLTSLGYRFESPDLPVRILSQTNYYPNLIQLYCHQLLRHVNAQHAAVFDPKSSPPYMITSRHVEEAYQSQDLRKAIRDRFLWTLQLDQRYEVIAYLIAYESMSDREMGIVEGLPVSWIRQEALTLWPEGFRDSPYEDSFRVLLDEMVGLGVLRIVGGGRYALRSPNVALLMGTREEIEGQLTSHREPPMGYEPETFRSAFREAENVDPSRRSPLTAQQESELRGRTNGVSIVFGSEAAGLNELEHFLESAFGKEFFIHLDRSAAQVDRASFAKHLADLGKRERDGTTLIFVPPLCPWNEYWVNEAMQSLIRLRLKTSFVRVLFVADPQTAWQLTSQHSVGLDSLSSQGVSIFTLRPWHDAAVRQWLDDSGFGPKEKQGREKITAVTANWPILLQNFYQRSRSDPHRWEGYLRELYDSIHDPTVARELARSLGLDRQEPRKVLRDLSALGEASIEDLIGIIGNIYAETIRRSLRWADLLALASPTGQGGWRIDPLVSRVLEVVAE